jgi:hypothetical protein
MAYETVKAIPFKFIIGFVILVVIVFGITTGEWPWNRNSS